MSYVRSMMTKARWTQRCSRSGETGDTLVEILIALVIISITVVALLGGLVTALTSSSEHRSLANLDTLLKDFAESAKYEIQQQPVTGSSEPLFTPCATTYSVASAPSPAQTAVGLPAGDGVPVTLFVTNLTPGDSVIPGVTSSSAGVTFTSIATDSQYTVPAASFPTDTGANGAANGTAASSGPFVGSVTATFYPPAMPAGKYIVTVSDGSDPSVTASEPFTTTPWVGPPTRVSGNEYSVLLTGYAPSAFVLSVTVGGQSAVIDSGQQLLANGTTNPTLDFTVPAGATGAVQVEDNAFNIASSGTAIGSSVAGTGSLGSTSISLAGYALSITGSSSSTSGVMWWDTSTNTWDEGTAASQTSCEAGGSSDNDGIQLITAVAAGPNGYTDSLSFVVTQPADSPNYPSITSVTPSSIEQGNSVSVTVKGSGFNNPWVQISGAGDTGVTPSSLTAPTSWTATQIVFTVNAAPGTVNTNYNITVSNNNGTGPSGSCWNCFTVTPGLTTPTNVVTPSTSSPTPGQSVTFTATITGTGANNPATGGSVTWTVSGSATSCTSSTALTAGAGATATATCTITMGAAGSSYTVSDTYSGNANYTSVTSSPVTVTVGKYTPTVAVTNSTPTTLGSSVKFTVTVTGSAGGPDPTGTITWTLTGPVSSCANTTALTSANPATASCTITASGAGTYTAQASYPGDGNYTAVTSNTDSFTVVKYTPTVSVTGVVSGSTLTFTATVVGPPNGATPTGQMVWSVTYPSGHGSTTVQCSSTSGPMTGAQPYDAVYTCVINNPSASDTYTAKASYQGDGNYNGATGTSNGVKG